MKEFRGIYAAVTLQIVSSKKEEKLHTPVFSLRIKPIYLHDKQIGLKVCTVAQKVDLNPTSQLLEITANEVACNTPSHHKVVLNPTQ